VPYSIKRFFDVNENRADFFIPIEGCEATLNQSKNVILCLSKLPEPTLVGRKQAVATYPELQPTHNEVF
jgi:hypothetical protein